MNLLYIFCLTSFIKLGVYSVGQKNVYTMSKYIDIQHDINSGIDFRYPQDANEVAFIINFAEMLEKQRLLISLQNKNNSLINKQLLLEKYNKKYNEVDYGFNVFAGGLLDEWNKDIE